MAEAVSGQFEASLDELEKIVARLEREELTLDESVRLFKVGRELAARCERLLTDAQQAIDAAMKDGVP
jgi:exodeoxyribonuclease VII small subunit